MGHDHLLLRQKFFGTENRLCHMAERTAVDVMFDKLNASIGGPASAALKTISDNLNALALRGVGGATW